MNTLPTIEFLVSLAREASEKILPLYGKAFEFYVSSGKEFHLKADLLSEKTIVKRIEQKFPGHFIFTEETARDFQETDFVWVIDPLDGTINFGQAIPFWAISIAFRLKGEVVLGAIFYPQNQEIFTAEKGKGAYLNGKKISVSFKKDLSQAVVGADCSGHVDLAVENMLQLGHLNKEIRIPRVLGASSLALSYVACGRLDAYFQNDVKPYDVAAGALLVKEAGGIVTQLKDEKWSIFDKSILAGTPSIHRQILARLK